MQTREEYFDLISRHPSRVSLLKTTSFPSLKLPFAFVKRDSPTLTSVGENFFSLWEIKGKLERRDKREKGGEGGKEGLQRWGRERERRDNVRKQLRGGKKRIESLDSLLNPGIEYEGRAKTGMNVSFISFYEITPSFNPVELVSSRHRNGARNENTLFVNRDK